VTVSFPNSLHRSATFVSLCPIAAMARRTFAAVIVCSGRRGYVRGFGAARCSATPAQAFPRGFPLRLGAVEDGGCAGHNVVELEQNSWESLPSNGGRPDPEVCAQGGRARNDVTLGWRRIACRPISQHCERFATMRFTSRALKTTRRG
jgi:hypothetical protein